MRIYIAGKYSAKTKKEREKNTKEAMKAWWKLIDSGFLPFCPHLSHFLTGDNPTFGMDRNPPAEFWYQYDAEWLKLCDAILVISNSDGVAKEIEIAQSLLIPVFYSVRELIAFYDTEGKE